MPRLMRALGHALLVILAAATAAATSLRGTAAPLTPPRHLAHADAPPVTQAQASQLRTALRNVVDAAVDAAGDPKDVECPAPITMDMLQQWAKEDPKGWIARATAYQARLKGCLVRDVTAQAALKISSLSDDDLSDESLLAWTDGVQDVVPLIQAATAARSAAFQVFHVTLTAGGVGAATTYVGAAAFDASTGRHIVGLATGTASGTLVQQTSTTTYRCCHSCWGVAKCCHDCTRTDNIGDSPAQIEAVVADLTHSALRTLAAYLAGPPTALVAVGDAARRAAPAGLGVTTWVRSRGEVASGPAVVEGTTEAQAALRHSVSMLEGLVDDAVQRLSKDSLAVAMLVQDRGFERLTASFTSGSFRGVPAQARKVVTVLRAAMSQATSGVVLPVLEGFAHALVARVLDVGEVIKMKLAWTMPSGTLNVMLALAAGNADGTIDVVTSHGETGFALTPNLLVLQHCHTGFLLFKSCHTDVLQVPHGLSAGEAAWIADYTATAAVKQMAQVFAADKPRATRAPGPCPRPLPAPVPAPAPDAGSGAGGDTKPNHKDESMWDALKGALAKTADGGFADLTKALASGEKSGIGKQLVNGAGLASVHEAATMQKFFGVKDSGLELFAKLLPDMLDMSDNPEMARQIGDRVLAASIMDDSEWLKMGLAFKMGEADNKLQHATVMYSHNSTTSKSNWLVLQTEIEFELAPYVYVVTTSHSYLGGLWTDSNDSLKKVPRGLTTADVVELMSFFNLAAMMSTAQFMGVPFSPPTLPQ